MRNPRNDTGRLNQAKPSPEGEGGAERTCILSREAQPRDGLLRLALSPDGQVLPDVRAKAPGRGAWIGVDRAELEVARVKGRLKGALARAFKTSEFTIPDDLADRIEAELRRAALERMGLEARAGNLTSGGERIAGAARSGQLHALYHAEDAGADGAGRLAQAWRVGSDREGSGLKGLALPVPRTTLSLALGRENVVHLGVTDARAAKRVGEAVARWLHFLGARPATEPCETGGEGAVPARIAGDETTTRRHEGF
jgi:hypothetical protein